MNSTYSKLCRVQHRVEAKPVCRFFGVLKADKHTHHFPGFLLVCLNWISSLTLLLPLCRGPLSTGHRIGTTFLNLWEKLSPFCPALSKLDRGGHQLQNSDPRNDLGCSQTCCVSITWEMVTMTNSQAPLQICWVRTSGVGGPPVCSHRFFRWLIHAQVWEELI